MQIIFFSYAEAKEVLEILPRESYTAIKEIQKSGSWGMLVKYS